MEFVLVYIGGLRFGEIGEKDRIWIPGENALEVNDSIAFFQRYFVCDVKCACGC